MVTKSIITFALIILLLSGCSAPILQPEYNDINSAIKDDNTKTCESPYLSITYVRDNLNNKSGIDMVFFTYDLDSKVLTEECILPFDSAYASGVVSKKNNKVYYSSNSELGRYNGGNCLWAYDLDTCKSHILNKENHEYNDILILDENTLLIMMVTSEHPIMPVTYDIPSDTFTYMADANNEPFIYTSGPIQPFYNYKTGMFTCIFWNEEEERGDYSLFKASLEHHLALLSKDMVKDPDKIFTYSSRADEMRMIAAVQISDDELLVTMENNYFYVDQPREYYSLVFGEDETTFTRTECPYPHADYVANLYTVDEGKTFYFYLYGDHFGNPPGIYSYDTESEELTPILLNDPETNGHYINFSIVGP